ncbi:hypothetical protein PVA45_04525 [Entomospira entomophila]|uniref:Uncharacterized protein n=1 Tax=Entomospira entomophila TaxID=2719988 RepID=A0A968KWF6_9SPIO|nr:hypothetical protein [Entomospira entomophilus]NIZ40770.1 hypothetical protein [Entomospira entomophilus]WDI34983.1 hypothetical protein PVA45_04525 [Entomospira entomophilus]
MKYLHWRQHFFLLIVLFLPLTMMIHAQARVTDRVVDEIFAVYLEHAEQAYALGYYDDAWQILLSSREFLQGYNQRYLNLSARLLFYQGYIQHATSLLNVLSESDSLQASTERDLYLVHLMHQNYQEINQLFKRGLLRTADAHFFQLLALYHQKKADTASFAWANSRKFNHDVRFFVPLLLLKEHQTIAQESIQLLRNIIDDHPEHLIPLDLESQNIVIALLRRLEQSLQAEMIMIMEPWLKNNINYQLILRTLVRENQELAQLALEAGEEVDPALLVVFDEPNWANLAGTYLLVDYLESLTDVAFIESSLAWAEDKNLDGFIELSSSVNADGNGTLTIHPMQDDYVAIEIRYLSHQIERVKEADLHVKAEINFSHFPYIDNINFAINDLQTPDLERDNVPSSLYHLHSMIYHLHFNALTLPHEIDTMMIGAETSLPVIQFSNKHQILHLNLLPLSNYIDELRDDHIFRRLRIVEGEIYQVWEDSTGNGFFNRFLSYQNGKIYGRRRFTPQDDYLLLEIYEKDELMGIAFSPDSELFEFYQEFHQERIVQVWDLDMNGYANIYRMVQQPPAQPRERRVWLQRLVRIEDLMNIDFREAKRWLEEVH